MKTKKIINQSILTILLLSMAFAYSFASADGWKYYEVSSGLSGMNRPALIRDSNLYVFDYMGYNKYKLNSDNTLSELTIIGTSRGMGLVASSAATTVNYVYFSGGEVGYTTPGLNSDGVYYASFDSKGYLSDPILTYHLKSQRAFHSSLVVNNRLYVFGGFNYNLCWPEYALRSVEYASIDTTNGAIKGPFQLTNSFSVISGKVFLAFNRGNRIYCLGETCEAPTHLATGCWMEYADIQADGSLGKWTALPGPYGINPELACLTPSSTLFVVCPASDSIGLACGRMDISDNVVEGKYFKSASSSNISRYGANIVSFGKKVYLLGGAYQDNYEVYDPDMTGTDLFTETEYPMFQSSKTIDISMDLK
jgi:hypothetical protein